MSDRLVRQNDDQNAHAHAHAMHIMHAQWRRLFPILSATVLICHWLHKAANSRTCLWYTVVFTHFLNPSFPGLNQQPFLFLHFWPLPAWKMVISFMNSPILCPWLHCCTIVFGFAWGKISTLHCFPFRLVPGDVQCCYDPESTLLKAIYMYIGFRSIKFINNGKGKFLTSTECI